MLGRKEELNHLNELYNSDCFEYLVMYGRRRVGKTTILQEFAEHSNAIFFPAREKNDALNLEDFSKVIQYHFDKKEPLLSIFYMTAEHDGDMNKYYQSGNITDVPPFLVRMFENGNDKSVG